MNSQTAKRVTDELRRIIKLFVDGNYSALAIKAQGIRLSANDMKYAIRTYGKSLVFPPDEAFDNIDIIEVKNSKPRRYSLRFDFWTKEEGRSDLTLEATVIEDAERLRWEIDDIHVL